MQDALLHTRKALLDVTGQLKIEIPVKISLGKLTLTQLSSFLESIKVSAVVASQRVHVICCLQQSGPRWMDYSAIVETALASIQAAQQADVKGWDELLSAEKVVQALLYFFHNYIVFRSLC